MEEANDRNESHRRHHRELYRLRMERETPEEAELRRARRRERDRHNRRLETSQQAEIRRATRRQHDNHRRDGLTAEQHHNNEEYCTMQMPKIVTLNHADRVVVLLK